MGYEITADREYTGYYQRQYQIILAADADTPPGSITEVLSITVNKPAFVDKKITLPTFLRSAI